jgi:hypothetical protein
VKVFRQRQRGSLLISIAIHAVVIVLLASITFRYEISDLLGISREKQPPPERIRYMVLPSRPAAPIGNGSNPTAVPPRAAPAPLEAPTVTPTTIPEPQRSAPTQGAISGRAGGTGGAPAGVATGVEPIAPDPRIPLAPGEYVVPQKTTAERVDSTVKAIFQAYNDSVAIAAANAGRDPADWTIERDGKKWGLDQKYIHLGKWKLPSMILGLLPLQPGGVDPTRYQANKDAAWMRRDIMENAQRAITEDEFKAAIKRIRERKERERRDREAVAASGGSNGSAVEKAGISTTTKP